MNGDSPLFHTLPLPNPVQYFGFDTEKTAPQLGPLQYRRNRLSRVSRYLDLPVEHLCQSGDYICESCSFHRPPLTVAVDELTELTNTSSHFKINGTNYHINIGGLYNIYNALAAVVAAHYFEVSPDVIKRGFDKSKAVFGRQETLKIGDKKMYLGPDQKSSRCDAY